MTLNNPSSSFADGRTIVTTAGTAVELGAVRCSWVTITAETDNTGIIAVGGSSVVAALATRRGIPLAPGDSVTLPVAHLSQVFIDSTVSTDGVTFAYGAS